MGPKACSCRQQFLRDSMWSFGKSQYFCEKRGIHQYAVEEEQQQFLSKRGMVMIWIWFLSFAASTEGLAAIRDGGSSLFSGTCK